MLFLEHFTKLLPGQRRELDQRLQFLHTSWNIGIFLFNGFPAQFRQVDCQEFSLGGS
jgi:hypothetical protein